MYEYLFEVIAIQKYLLWEYLVIQSNKIMLLKFQTNLFHFMLTSNIIQIYDSNILLLPHDLKINIANVFENIFAPLILATTMIVIR